MGAAVDIVNVADVEPIELLGRELVANGGEVNSSLGYSVFTPGTERCSPCARDGGGRVRRPGRASCDSTTAQLPSARETPCTSRRRLARGRQHGRRGRDHGPASRTPTTRRRSAGDGLRYRPVGARASRLGLPHPRARGVLRSHARPRQRAARRRRHRLHQAQGLALDEVSPEDVVEVDDPSAALHLETVIHTEIYALAARRRRHRPRTSPLRDRFATTAGLELLTHDAVLFADGVAYFEETSELITEEDQGRAVAEALGHRRAVILRNHGVVVADADVRWAVLSSITLERAVRLQAIATGWASCAPCREATRSDACRQVPGSLRGRVLGRLDPQRPESRRRPRHASGMRPSSRSTGGRRSARSSRRSCCSTFCATGSG